MRRVLRLRTAALATAALLVLGILTLWLLNVRGEAGVREDLPVTAPPPALVARGADLARAGNCAACHTAPGGAAYAGGVPIATPFGTVHAGNLTPDVRTGLGLWNADHFWRALHHGRSRDGRLLVPAFPYTEYTRVTREDADALFAYLRSLPAVVQPNRPHALRFPYGSQLSLAVWRALFFRPGEFTPDAQRSAEWNRGAYLVQGLGHCQACHAPRNALGASDGGRAFQGGLIPVQRWYAPSLADRREAGVQGWSTEAIVQLLRDGRTADAATLGPMADVVAGSTRHLDAADLRAMAVFLQALPERTSAADAPAAPAPMADDVRRLGARLYADHCAACHGTQGQGVPGIYLPLAGQRSLTQPSSANLLKTILGGGFAPTTPGNPRPFGMPPFSHQLGDAEIAALATFVRSAWGNQAGPVSELDVARAR